MLIKGVEKRASPFKSFLVRGVSQYDAVEEHRQPRCFRAMIFLVLEVQSMDNFSYGSEGTVRNSEVID
jgi:hypothetical protein